LEAHVRLTLEIVMQQEQATGPCALPWSR
jgi:hypothetical protein